MLFSASGSGGPPSEWVMWLLTHMTKANPRGGTDRYNHRQGTNACSLNTIWKAGCKSMQLHWGDGTVLQTLTHVKQTHAALCVAIPVYNGSSKALLGSNPCVISQRTFMRIGWLVMGTTVVMHPRGSPPPRVHMHPRHPTSRPRKGL